MEETVREVQKKAKEKIVPEVQEMTVHKDLRGEKTRGKISRELPKIERARENGEQIVERSGACQVAELSDGEAEVKVRKFGPVEAEAKSIGEKGDRPEIRKKWITLA